MQGAKYSKSVQAEFSKTLNERVDAYFKNNQIDPLAGSSMILKSVLLFGLYAIIYLCIISGIVSSVPLLFFLWALLGLGQAFIGMSIMHDTVHGAYTRKGFARNVLEVPIIVIGVEPMIWKIEHNILHHTYTNVEGIDQDIHPRYVFRFTVHQPKKWFHSYQHIYATFVYGLLIIEWLTVKDFIKVIKYHRMGFFKSYAESAFVAMTILAKKLIFYFVFLYLPIHFLSFDSKLVTAMFITMLVVAGIIMTIIFQLAHVVSHCNAESSPSNLADKNWHVYQLQTTCDFAHNNLLLSYLIGGLNYQIEHHLFPRVCHVHYPEISKIVKQTANEFGIEYHYEDSFMGAIKAHYLHLKELGNNIVANG